MASLIAFVAHWACITSINTESFAPQWCSRRDSCCHWPVVHILHWQRNKLTEYGKAIHYSKSDVGQLEHRENEQYCGKRTAIQAQSRPPLTVRSSRRTLVRSLAEEGHAVQRKLEMPLLLAARCIFGSVVTVICPLDSFTDRLRSSRGSPLTLFYSFSMPCCAWPASISCLCTNFTARAPTQVFSLPSPAPVDKETGWQFGSFPEGWQEWTRNLTKSLGDDGKKEIVCILLESSASVASWKHNCLSLKMPFLCLRYLMYRWVHC